MSPVILYKKSAPFYGSALFLILSVKQNYLFADKRENKFFNNPLGATLLPDCSQ